MLQFHDAPKRWSHGKQRKHCAEKCFDEMDILRPYPEYPAREHWTDRVFYRAEDGLALP